MGQNVKIMHADTPCICGSGRTWKQCCGQYLQAPDCAVGVVRKSSKQSVRFFLADLKKDEVYTNEAGQALVFMDRAQALNLGQQLNYKYQVVGMSEESWTLFQKEIPNHLVIETNFA